MSLPIHLAAQLFPLIEGEEFNALVADIKTNGLHETIKLFNGEVLDGRNRLRACAAAGVEPRFEDVTTTAGDPLAYVVSANVNRRHLTAGQRAFIASELATIRHGSNQFQTETEESSAELSTDAAALTKESAAKGIGSTSGAISKARVIAKEAPELVADVKSGKATLDGAYNKAIRARDTKAAKPRQQPPPQTVTSAEPDALPGFTIDALLAAIEQRTNKTPTAGTIKAHWTRLDEDQQRRFVDIAAALVNAATVRERNIQFAMQRARLVTAERLAAGRLPAPPDVFDTMTSFFHSGRNTDPRAHTISVWLNEWRPIYKVAAELEVAEAERATFGKPMPRTLEELVQQRDRVREGNRRSRERAAKNEPTDDAPPAGAAP